MQGNIDRDGTDLSIDRRTVLKASGAAAIGLTGFSGTASASPPDELRFCGCSQVCVGFEQDRNSYRILYATETADGYTCSLEPSITESEPRTPDCYTVDPGEKIIGVLDGQRTLYPNPNTCAQRAIDSLGDLNDCAGCTEDDGSDGSCIRNRLSVDDYTMEGRHEYTVNDVTIRTRLCKPPAQWKDDPNGPPSEADSNGPPERGGPPNENDSNGPPSSRGPSTDYNSNGPPSSRGPPEEADSRGPPSNRGPSN